MLAVNLDLVSTQTQTIQSSLQKNDFYTGSSSFMDLLRSADEELKSEEKSQVSDRKISNKEEDSSARNDGSLNVAVAEHSKTDEVQKTEAPAVKNEAETQKVAEAGSEVSLDEIRWLKTPVLKGGAEANENSEVSSEILQASLTVQLSSFRENFPSRKNSKKHRIFRSMTPNCFLKNHRNRRLNRLPRLKQCRIPLKLQKI